MIILWYTVNCIYIQYIITLKNTYIYINIHIPILYACIYSVYIYIDRYTHVPIVSLVPLLFAYTNPSSFGPSRWSHHRCVSESRAPCRSGPNPCRRPTRPRKRWQWPRQGQPSWLGWMGGFGGPKVTWKTWIGKDQDDWWASILICWESDQCKAIMSTCKIKR
jgi:hypothetical protein